MLIHVPGNIDNYLALEIKPITGKKDQLKKDLETLTAFRIYGHYRRAILLIYGNSDRTFSEMHQKLNSIVKKDNETKKLIDKTLIEIWHHHKEKTPATNKGW